MEPVRRQYDDGPEMAHVNPTEYPGMRIDQYGGMDVNQYPGNSADDEPGRRNDNSTVNVYDEDAHSRLHRGLKTRQISMIALGGALGTGLLINTGPYLAASGPVSMLIGYALVGVLCAAVMSAIGEMAAWLPIPSGFTGFAVRFVDPALGFALGVGITGSTSYIITLPNNLIASALIIESWFYTEDGGYTGGGSQPALYITIFLVCIITINYFGVGVFGEIEFWLSSAKVLIMIFLIIFLLVIAAGGGSVHHPVGFHYWVHPGPFANYDNINGGGGRFLGFWNVLSSAVFSFLGAELVGVTVGEAQSPRKAIPRAIKLTFFRIVFFYLFLILFLGMTVPYNSPLLLSANTESTKTVSAHASPFIVAAQIAGMSSWATAINVFLIIFTFSASNSDLYIATRTIYSLSIEGNAPRIFSRTDDRGVPIFALGLSSAFGLIAYISKIDGVLKTYTYLVTLVTIFGILTWISILISHIYFVRARRAQHIPDTALVYVSPFGIRGSMAALIFACVITFFNGFNTFIRDPVTGEKFNWRQFIVDYIGIVIFVGMVFGYKMVMKTKTVKADEADLYGGKAKIDEDEREFLAEESRKRGSKPESKWEKVYRWTLGNFF